MRAGLCFAGQPDKAARQLAWHTYVYQAAGAVCALSQKSTELGIPLPPWPCKTVLPTRSSVATERRVGKKVICNHAGRDARPLSRGYSYSRLAWPCMHGGRQRGQEVHL